MTYMAACDSSTCDKYSGSTDKWLTFVDWREGGGHLVPAGRQCVSLSSFSPSRTNYLVNSTHSERFTGLCDAPDASTVTPGQYLVRHEIIALRLAVKLGGADFYPSCTQIHIGGSQTGTLNQTVLFPGAYNDNDPGIYDLSAHAPGAAYTFPGPPCRTWRRPRTCLASCGRRGLWEDSRETRRRRPRRKVQSRRLRLGLGRS